MSNAEEFLIDLDGGAFVQKVATALGQVAIGVCTHERKGKVKIEFDLQRIGASQVNVTHTLTYNKPTKNGEAAEKNVTKTAMHVNQDGRMTFFPENQDQLFTIKGEVNQGAKQ